VSERNVEIVRDGLVVRYEWFQDPQDAVNAVGLSP
jgi:hypothetical protein